MIRVDAHLHLRRRRPVEPARPRPHLRLRPVREGTRGTAAGLVHVHTNSGLGVLAYSDRKRLPVWFHEGTATYLAGDPHAGLSKRYRQYQNLFFYLVQRFGVDELTSFYRTIFAGRTTADALAQVYGIGNSLELQNRARRWHRTADAVRLAFWITAVGLVLGAFRGADFPVLGGLLVLAGATLAASLAFGLAEHLQGLNGGNAVLAAKAVIALAAVAAGGTGLMRILRHYRALKKA